MCMPRLRILKICVVFLFVVCLWSLSTSSVKAADYYVSTSGNDGSDGLTTGTAWKTITKAAGIAQAGDTVNIMAGTYYEILKNPNTPEEIIAIYEVHNK